MEKDLDIDAAHPNETRIVLKSKNHIEEYEYENIGYRGCKVAREFTPADDKQAGKRKIKHDQPPR